MSEGEMSRKKMSCSHFIISRHARRTLTDRLQMSATVKQHFFLWSVMDDRDSYGFVS